MTTERPDPTRSGIDAADGVRVALREVRETAFRALLAAGASAGEADTAADLVLYGEVQDRAGLTALLTELDRVPSGRVPISRHTCGGLDVLRDPAGRGPLLFGPPAADLAGCGQRAVLLSGCAWSPALEWVLLDTAGRARTALLAVETAPDGTPTAAALAAADGALYRARPRAALDGLLTEPVVRATVGPGARRSHGVVLSRWAQGEPPGCLALARSRAERDARRAEAASSLRVEPGTWARAYAASRRFLVPENPPAPEGCEPPAALDAPEP